MRVPRLRLSLLALASGIVLSGCAYDMYGDPYGYGYDNYGYGPRSSVSIGIGYGGYGYGGYGYGGYGGYGYGYPYGGYDPFGWYGDYYYPGTGIYVYDRSRHRHQWTDEQRRYWEQRRQQWHDHGTTGAAGTTGVTTTTGENWSRWDRSHWRDRNTGVTTSSNQGGRQSLRNAPSATTNVQPQHNSNNERSNRGHSRERSDERPQ